MCFPKGPNFWFLTPKEPIWQHWSWLKSTCWFASGFAVCRKNKLPFLVFLLAMQNKLELSVCLSEEAARILLVTWRVQLRCDACFVTSLPSSSLQFSLLAVVVRTTLNKIMPRRFQLHLRKARFYSGISFHLFIFSYFVAFAVPSAKRGKRTFEFLAVQKLPTTSNSQVRSRW